MADRDVGGRLLLREICQSCGWHVTGSSQTVSDAMTVIARTRPHCLITGYRFDGDDTGLDLINQARRLSPGLFTMLYTGWDINDVAAQITVTTPDRILRKPMPPHRLVDLLTNLQSRFGPAAPHTARIPVSGDALPPPGDRFTLR